MPGDTQNALILRYSAAASGESGEGECTAIGITDLGFGTERFERRTLLDEVNRFDEQRVRRSGRSPRR